MKQLEDMPHTRTGSADEREALQIGILCAKGSALVSASHGVVVFGEELRRRYLEIREEILPRIAALEDDFYRDFAAFHAIEMCVSANDLPLAQTLCGRLTTLYIRLQIDHFHPYLAYAH